MRENKSPNASWNYYSYLSRNLSLMIFLNSNLPWMWWIGIWRRYIGRQQSPWIIVLIEFEDTGDIWLWVIIIHEMSAQDHVILCSHSRILRQQISRISRKRFLPISWTHRPNIVGIIGAQSLTTRPDPVLVKIELRSEQETVLLRIGRSGSIDIYISRSRSHSIVHVISSGVVVLVLARGGGRCALVHRFVWFV